MDPNASVDEPMLEAYSTLAFIAGATRHVQLGTMVTWATMRPPALLIKSGDAPHRLYIARTLAHFVLGEHDRRLPVAIVG